MDFREKSELQSDLDAIVEAFERAWTASDQPPNVADFIPAAEHPDWQRIVTELLCLDLEFRHQDGASEVDLLEHYQGQFSELLENRDVLKELAFEDYRWQIQHGRNITRDDYAARFNIGTDHWPAPPTANEETNALAKGSTLQAKDVIHPLQDAMVLLPDVGAEFQGFQLVDRLGAGRFGRVFLAEQRDLANRHVVLKLSTQLWNEADRLARLQHTNIVPIYSVHQSDGVQAVCMPYLGSQTLKGLLQSLADQGRVQLCGQDLLKFCSHDSRAKGTSSQVVPARAGQVNQQLATMDHEQTCLWIVSKLAAGIGHAHDRAILHRDIKPANVLLSTDAEPMILDFNLSEDLALGGHGAILVGGTLPYMSPEHIRAVATGEATNVTADIYSLGVILFQLLTCGKLPFEHRSGESDRTVADMLEDRLVAPTLPSDTRASVSARAIVDKCLSPNPDDRYQTAHGMREDIERHLANKPLKHTAEPLGVRARKWLRRNPQLRSAGSICGLFMVLLAVVASVAAVRGERLADMRALNSYRNFLLTADDARAALSTPSIDASLRDDARRSLEQTMPIFDSATLSTNSDFLRLDLDRQKRVREILTELHFVLAVDWDNRAKMLEGHDREAARRAALEENRLAQLTIANNSNWAVLHQQASLLAELGEDDKSLEIRASAGEFDAGGFVDRYLAALQNIRDGKTQTGKDLLTKLTEQAPRNFLAWHLLGATQASLGNLDAAEECFTHCKAISPESSLARFQRGITRLERSDFRGAKEDFDFVLRTSPDNAATLLSRAHAFRGMRHYHSAIDDLNAAEKSGRYPTRVPLLRGKLWKQLGETEKAESDMLLGLRSTPNSPDGWVARGLAKLANDVDGALDDVRMALRLRPNYRVGQHNLAMILAEHVQDFDAALTVYDQMVESNPADWRTRRSRAVLHARMGAATEATADLAKVFADDWSAQTYYQAACVYSLLSADDPQKTTQAIALLRKALQLDGKTWLDYAKRDADLASIRQRPEFNNLIEAVDALFEQP